MNKIFLTGDLHGRIQRLVEFNNLTTNLTKEDIVIVLGDFGVFWNDEEGARASLRTLGKLSFTTAFVDGNHEDFPLIQKLENVTFWNEGYAGIMPGGTIHLLRGEIYKIANKTIGIMGGANSVDKHRRIEGRSWWNSEEITDEDIQMFEASVDKFNLQKVDYVLTHDCPSSMVPQVALYSGINGAKISPSQLQLEKILNLVDYDNWFFGHWHIDQSFDNRMNCLYERIVEIK